jgi:hypothetical protein
MAFFIAGKCFAVLIQVGSEMCIASFCRASLRVEPIAVLAEIPDVDSSKQGIGVCTCQQYYRKTPLVVVVQCSGCRKAFMGACFSNIEPLQYGKFQRSR